MKLNLTDKLLHTLLANEHKMSANLELSTIQLNLQKMAIDAIASSTRALLEKCADQIILNFDTLALVAPNARKDVILRIFGLDNAEIVKINAPAKKSTADPSKKNTKKDKTESTIPPYFWGYKGDNGKFKCTFNSEYCTGLTAGIYGQCPNKPENGSEFCKKCKKDADTNESNHGIPKRGTIKMRIEQFKADPYLFTPPGGKPKKIYFKQWALAKKYTEDQINEMINKHNSDLSQQAVENLLYVPPKRETKAKTKNLTDDMKGKKNKNKKPQQEFDDDDANDENDEDGYYSDATGVGNAANDDDGYDSDATGVGNAPDMPNDDDEDNEEIIQPKKTITKKKEDKIINTDPYKTIALDDVRYAILKTVNPRNEDETEFDLYEITDYVAPKKKGEKPQFKLVSETPHAKYNTESGEIVYY